MKVMFLVNGRWFKTLCKTVLEADTFDVSISTEKHNIYARISEKCYFTSIDNYCLGYDTIDTIKTDFCFKRNYKNIKEFTAKLEDCFSSFINNSITDRHFHGNIDECISKILDDIKKESKRETEATETEATTEKVWTPTPTPTPTAHTKSLLNSAYGITAERETATDHTYEIRVFKNGVFICSRTFSLESFAETAFSIMEMNAIDFPEPCFNVIELFKGGKLVKMSSIYFGKIALEVKK